eukprot:Gb_18640 [translate_table: standard]
MHVVGNKTRASFWRSMIQENYLILWVVLVPVLMVEGGCLRSYKGPWKDPVIMKLVLDREVKFVRQTMTVLINEGKANSHGKLHHTKVKDGNISTVELGSDVEDVISPSRSRDSGFTPVYEEAKMGSQTSSLGYDDSTLLTRIRITRRGLMEANKDRHAKLDKEEKDDNDEL